MREQLLSLIESYGFPTSSVSYKDDYTLFWSVPDATVLSPRGLLSYFNSDDYKFYIIKGIDDVKFSDDNIVEALNDLLKLQKKWWGGNE